MGIFMGVATLSSMSGPVIGSVMTQSFGWRSLFFVNVLLCAPCVWVLRRNLRGGPEHPPLALPRSDRPGQQLAANLVFAVGVLGG
ncbi:MFS transporter [Nannocystis pusilla]|uniref:MFS transporter n=1 Tax=Nannocystis pusilla TaxID=889268 RepID=UPI003B77CFF4